MKIGMLFPGYGNQFVGMAKELYDHSRLMQEYFEEASSCLNINFVKLCFASSDIELSKIPHAYPAMFLVGVATAALLKQIEVPIHAVAGHGLGEYSALCTAGGLSFPDGLYLLSKLGLFYAHCREDLQQRSIKSILINGLSARKLKQLCSQEQSSTACTTHIAVYETKTEHIVTGQTEAVDALIESAYEAGADVLEEKVCQEGFHTPFLAQVVEQLKIYLTKVDFKDLAIPLISGVDAQYISHAQKAQDALIRQIIEPLHWHSVLKSFAHTDLLLVPAPAKALVAELQMYYPHKKIIALQAIGDLERIKSIVHEFAHSN
jgi:[acyl-carrier-protein] S-malonyltransferase